MKNTVDEYQIRFKKGKFTGNHIFSLNIILEKCRSSSAVYGF